MLIVKKLRVGLIGAGGIGNVHLEAFSKNASCEIVAVASRTGKHGKIAADKFNIPKIYVKNGWERMLKDTEMDVVSICTPNYLHAPMILKAIENGIDILCEKPICISREELDAIEKNLVNSDLIFFTAFHKRFIDYIFLVKNIIDRGQLGRITAARYFFSHFGPYKSWNALSEEKWFFDSNKAGGGVLLDLGVHCIDLMQFLIDDYSIIEGFNYGTSCIDITDEDNCNVIFRFKNNALGNIAVSWCTAPTDVLEIFGTHGSLKVDFLSKNPLTPNPEDIIENEILEMAAKLKASEEVPHQNLINIFVSCVLNNVKGNPDFQDGKKAVEFVLDSYAFKI